jgi:hypothetical protein
MTELLAAFRNFVNAPKNYIFCVYSAVVFCVISERRLFLYTELIDVFFVMEAVCVYCSVRTESLTAIPNNLLL